MDKDRQFWQQRYRQQVGWTESLRRFVLAQIGVSQQANILEVGCGYGALLEALSADGYRNLTGLDIDLPALNDLPSISRTVCADGMWLPFPKHTFDLCVCHFYLMWVKEPLRAIQAMCAIVKPGGWMIALAEPDYSARVDAPKELEALGRWQAQALQKQGADISIGSHLTNLFHGSGLAKIQSGVLSPVESQSLFLRDWEMEWQVMREDMAGKVSPVELDRLQAVDRKAWEMGTRKLYVPIHYAYGQSE